MSDPGDKSDDLISELAKLMASGTSGESAVKPIARPAPLSPTATSSAPIRIPGMDAPAAPVSAAPQPEPRAPATGTIRIPGMDQPAPVTTSAPVSKFDFGKAPVAPAIRQEPIAAPVRAVPVQPARLEPQRTEFVAAPVRTPEPRPPVQEPRAFVPAPVAPRPVVTEPALAPVSDDADGGFTFDFGFGKQPDQPPANDPIGDLIAAEMDAEPTPAPVPAPEQVAPAGLPPREPRPVEPVPAPVMRMAAPQQAAPQRPAMSPLQSAAARPASSAPIPLKPVSVAPRPVESDRFAISPGMGLNGRPAANQPLNPQPLPPREPEPYHDDSDPMSEIESLIGEAVRVELGPGPIKVQTPVEVKAEAQYEPIVATPAPQPVPVVPPLTTQFAPRRSGLVDHGTDAAEDAILAAAADSGAELGRLDGSLTDESPYRRLKVKPARAPILSGGMRQYVGMAVAGTLLLAAGLGLYWVLNMGRGNTPAAAPVLTADATPVKVAPTPEVTAETETVRSPVLDQLDGAAPTPSTEQLVSTDETGGQDVTRVVGGTEEADTEGGLANRKVRTVTVRPDGTIVPGDDAVAGAEELPVDRPNVPEVPGETADETVNLLGDETIVTTDPITAAIDGVTPPAGDALATTDTAANTLAALGGVIDPTKVAPTPAPRPDREAMAFAAEAVAAQPLAAVAEPVQQVDLLAEAAPVEATPTASGGAAAYVQLASSTSQAEADAAVQNATARYGSLFAGNSLVVQRADLGQKGVRYRVRLPTASLAEATRICSDIKANGGDCYATNS